MEENIKQNIERRIELGHRIYGTYRYWKAAEGENKSDAWRDYVGMRREYRKLMDEFDDGGIIPDHSFQLERHKKLYVVCRYWPGRNGRVNGNGMNGNGHN